TRDQLFGYMDSHYTPERTVIAVAGNAKHERVVELVDRFFAASSREPRDHTRLPAPAYNADALTEKRPTQQAHIVLGTRSYDVYDPRRSVLSVLNTLLGGGMSSRLN